MPAKNQLLGSVNDTIQPAIRNAYRIAAQKNPFDKKGHFNVDTFGFFLKSELENKREELSRLLYELDLQINENTLGFNAPKKTNPSFDYKKYVKEAFGGFQINRGDGTAIQVSKSAEITITQNTTTYEDRTQAVIEVIVNDPATNTQLHFIDSDSSQRGFEKMYSWNTNSSNTINDQIYWEDPMYNMAKNSTRIGIGTSGVIAGALEARELANFTPWRTGESLKDAVGWYRKSNGTRIALDNLKNGRGAAGHRIGAEYAGRRDIKFRTAGKICFGISVAFSVNDIRNSYINNDYNQNEVYLKAGIDIFMGAVGVWGGPIGWGISGTYFILDTFGAFGTFGEASGVSKNGIPYNGNVFDADFEMDLAPHQEFIQQRLLREREVRIDNTYVAPPKILFKKNLK